MFHAVNGDRRGNGRVDQGGLSAGLDLPKPNKGDRGYSDQTEARTFLIGTPPKAQTVR